VLRIIDHLAAGHEARAEGALISIEQLAVILDHVLRVVRSVGHDQAERVARVGVDACVNGLTEAAPPLVFDTAHGWILLRQLLEHFGRAVGAVVVHDQDLVRDVFAIQRVDERMDRRGDTALFIVSGNDDGELHDFGRATMKDCAPKKRHRIGSAR
jgi:hypothetical protein